MLSRVRVTMHAKTEEDKTLYHRSTTKAEGGQLESSKASDFNSKAEKNGHLTKL